MTTGAILDRGCYIDVSFVLYCYYILNKSYQPVKSFEIAGNEENQMSRIFRQDGSFTN